MWLLYSLVHLEEIVPGEDLAVDVYGVVRFVVLYDPVWAVTEFGLYYQVSRVTLPYR